MILNRRFEKRFGPAEAAGQLIGFELRPIAGSWPERALVTAQRVSARLARRHAWKSNYRVLFAGICSVLLSASQLTAQAVPPVLLYDEAHHNYPAAGMSAFLDIARSLGAEVQSGRRTLDQELRSAPAMLVIARAMPIPRAEFLARFAGVQQSTARSPMFWSDDLERPAFSSDEVRAVFDYVSAGGSLLLIVDHTAAPEMQMARALGTELRHAFTWDALHYPPGYNVVGLIGRFASYVYYSRDAGTIGDHPIMNGAGDADRVNAVAAYVGSSLQGPIGSTPLLMLSDSAFDYYRAWPDGPEHRVSAAGRSQAVAYELGQGRVVIVAEISMLMKDPLGPDDPNDPQRLGSGLDYAHADNRQFAHNMLGWLLRTR